MMKFKWQLNFDTIHIMRSGEKREEEKKHNIDSVCVWCC